MCKFNDHEESAKNAGRRNFLFLLGNTTAWVAAGALLVPLFSAAQAVAGEAATPRLMEGNQRYVADSGAVKVTQLLKTSTSWDGQPLVYPRGTAQVTGMLVELSAGAETGWHLHPVPSFALLLEGEMEVTLKDGSKKRLKAGDAVAEVVGTWHNGRNPGYTPAKLVVFYAGVEEMPLTTPAVRPLQ